MLDPYLMRNNLQDVKQGLTVRGYELDVETLLQLENKRKELQVETEKLQHERNSSSKEIGKAKAVGKDIQPLLESVSLLGKKLKSYETDLDTVKEELDEVLRGIPNLPHESVPAGNTEDENEEVKSWGTHREFNFEPKDHVDIGEKSGLLDFETATTIASARFVVMRNSIARLHRALIQFMLDIHTQEHGYWWC